MRIVIDAMGTDNFPGPDVEGGVLAAREWGGRGIDEIILVGDQKTVEAELNKHDTAGLNIRVVHASEIVEMTDKPRDIVRGKPDSSMHVGMNLVKDGEADGYISMGNTGGTLAVAMLGTLKRIKGVKRPVLGSIVPIPGNPVLVDNGANADCTPEQLLQFGQMGAIFSEAMLGKTNPRVGTLSNGEEDGKGNTLTLEAGKLLAESNLNYIGNVEPKEFMMLDKTDVLIADGFVGNIMVKTIEATARLLIDVIREEITAGPVTTLGGLLARPALRRVGKRLDSSEIGGAPLLGVNGVVMIGHGSSNAKAIKNACNQARMMVEADIVGKIRDGI